MGSTAGKSAPRVLLFGDTSGLPRLLEALGSSHAAGMVHAAIRPEQEPALAELATQRGLPLLRQPRASDPGYESFVEQVRDLQPGLILVDSYSMLLRADVLEIPELGCLNVHFAPLPRYRGPNPVQWALIRGERETAVTLHFMTETFDAGDIVAQDFVPIRFADTWLDVVARLESQAEQMLARVLPEVLHGGGSGAPQDERAATKLTRRGPDDGRIDWDASVAAIYNLIRALVPPLPPAFYDRDGKRLSLERRLSIDEVAALKLSLAPTPPSEAGFRLAAPRCEPGREESLTFDVVDQDGDPQAAVSIAIEWNRRAGSLSVVGANSGAEQAAWDLGADYLERELELKPLTP